jgi:hypothetical protein
MQMKPHQVEQLVSASSDDDRYEIVDDFFSNHASDVPLQSLCKSGGFPDEDNTPDIHVDGNIQMTSSSCAGTLTAYFAEKVYPSGCPDMPKRWERTGDVNFVIELPSGKVSFS